MVAHPSTITTSTTTTISSSSILPSRPPSLQEATEKATALWQSDLQRLFHHAKDRFPDVVWELLGDDEPRDKEPEEVWGHKAIVYARAPPSFQARYFSFRPAPLASPVPYAPSPAPSFPAQSNISLSLGIDYPGPGQGSSSRSSTPESRVLSPTPSANTTATQQPLLRLPTAINPILFTQELEYLYTGQGFREAFEFLFDTSADKAPGLGLNKLIDQDEDGEMDEEEARIDKLRKDLVFMWRSRLYSDV